MFTAYAVFRINRRAPAVISADAPHGRQDRYDRIPRLRQFLQVSGMLQLLRRIRKNRSLKRTSLRGKPNAVSRSVRHLHPSDSGAVSAFLRNEIARYAVRRRILKDSEACACVSVTVILLRSPAVPLEITTRSADAESHAEQRQLRQSFPSEVVSRGFNPAFSVHLVNDLRHSLRNRWQAVGIGDTNAVFPFFHHAGFAVVKRKASGAVPGGAGYGEFIAFVVIRSRSPVHRHGNLPNPLPSVIDEGYNAALLLREYYVESISLHANIYITVNNSERKAVVISVTLFNEVLTNTSLTNTVRTSTSSASISTDSG